MALNRWNASAELADSRQFDAGESVRVPIRKIRRPTVCVRREADDKRPKRDTVRITFQGSAGWYCAEERTFDGEGSMVVDLPQSPRVAFESEDGGTYSAEVRSRP